VKNSRIIKGLLLSLLLIYLRSMAFGGDSSAVTEALDFDRRDNSAAAPAREGGLDIGWEYLDVVDYPPLGKGQLLEVWVIQDFWQVTQDWCRNVSDIGDCIMHGGVDLSTEKRLKNEEDLYIYAVHDGFYTYVENEVIPWQNYIECQPTSENDFRIRYRHLEFETGWEAYSDKMYEAGDMLPKVKVSNDAIVKLRKGIHLHFEVQYKENYLYNPLMCDGRGDETVLGTGEDNV
jgi:hypothetical protein